MQDMRGSLSSESVGKRSWQIKESRREEREDLATGPVHWLARDANHCRTVHTVWDQFCWNFDV